MPGQHSDGPSAGRSSTCFRGRPAPADAAKVWARLYIVRQLVEAHGGRVEVSSIPGERTRFTVRLPRREG